MLIYYSFIIECKLHKQGLRGEKVATERKRQRHREREREKGEGWGREGEWRKEIIFFKKSKFYWSIGDLKMLY